MLGAPYVASATGTRRYIRERQLATSKDHLIAWLARLRFNDIIIGEAQRLLN